MIIGTIKDGVFVKNIGGFDIKDLPEATETTSGLMSVVDKNKVDNAYTSKDIATISQIDEMFKK